MYRRLFRNGALVRALLSFGAAYTAEWAFTVAISLVAYADGGAVAVGLVGLLRLVPAALLAPAVSTYADRLPREKVLFVSSAVRGLATLLTAPILIAGGPTWIVYALAIVSTIAFTPYRASHSALMPLLCRAPEELTSINVVRGLLDSLSVVVGPFVAAVLVSVSDVASVFVFAGVCGLLSAVLVLGLKYERVPVPVSKRRILGEIREGVRAVVGQRRRLASSSSSWSCRPRIRGAFTVFVVVVAIDLLGPWRVRASACSRARWASARWSAALACTLLVGSRAMTRWLAVAVVLWGVPAGRDRRWCRSTPSRCAAAAVIGVGNAMVDVTAFTLIGADGARRRAGPGLRVLESLGALGRRTGLAGRPVARRDARGPRGAGRVGLLAPVVCVLFWWRATQRRPLGRGADRRHRPAPPGADAASAAGDRDRAAGAERRPVRRTRRGRRVRGRRDGRQLLRRRGGAGRGARRRVGGAHHGPGGGLRRDRAAREHHAHDDVRAVEATRLLGISAGDFLPAVTGISEARTAAEDALSEHLRHAPGRAADDVGPTA